PRRALYGSVPDAVLDVRLTNRVSEQPDRERPAARAVRAESNGRGGRGLPLGAARCGYRARPDYYRVEHGSGAAPGQRRVLFPPDGKDVRRCGVGWFDEQSRASG